MAQIGSPSAGWYTDPSGQHRARYWDGDSWTEQVRDDLGEAAETAVAAPEAPPVQAPPVQAAPPGVPATSAQEPPSAHPMADTVAGVAEAVAAVAANDLAAPTPEPLNGK